MKLRRVLIWLMVLIVFLSQVTPVLAEEESDGTIDLIDTFYATTTHADHSMRVPFNRSWFKNDARVYNHDLAKLSLGLATSAFRPSKKRMRETKAADYDLRSFLDQAGFSDLRSDDYNKDPSMYTVSTVMGHQTIGEGDDSFVLIAVGICGQGYLDEWESNLTVGTGKNPIGFASAAHLVYDRVFGYISENHLKGKMKIWVSGFSRAAAISNITASLLSDSDTFSQENVFAYTFATPMTVREKEPKSYENIFNICGKMDPVTNVPFADWGYSRYGITYYTPTMETDSDFWAKRKKADVIYKEITGINYWANPDMNSQLRVLMDCLLSICPDVETYTDSLQKYLIALWEKHDAVSVLSRLLEMANDPILINDENRMAANIMMNQITSLIMDYTSSENSFKRFNKNASVGSNVMQTHTPELYISWVFSVDDPAELYTDYYDYTLLYITGDAIVSVARDNEVLETIETGEIEITPYRYLSIRDFKISVFIPRDSEYTITIKSNKDQTLEALESGFKVGRQAPDETMRYTSDMQSGDVMNITYDEYGRELHPEGTFTTSMAYQAEKSQTSIELLLDAYSFPEGVSWRDLVLFFLMAAVLLVTTAFFIITLLSMWYRHRYKRKHGFIPKDSRFRPLPIICFFLIQQFFLTKEFFSILYEPSAFIINCFKIVIGLLIVVIAIYGYRRKKNSFHRTIIFAVILLTGADVLITTSITGGAVLYIAAYILLVVNYARIDKPGIVRILLWILLSAAAIFYLGTFKGDYGYLKYIAYMYMVSGIALVISSLTHSARISRGSFLLFVAGILMVLNTAWGNSVILHFVSAALHYIAVSIIASTGSGFTLPIIVPEYAIDSETDPDPEPVQV